MAFHASPWASSGVVAGIDAEPAAENPSSGVEDAVGAEEGLGWGLGGGVGEGHVEVLHVDDAGFAVRGASPLQEEDVEALGEGGSERAAGVASSYYDVVEVRLFSGEYARFLDVWMVESYHVLKKAYFDRQQLRNKHIPNNERKIGIMGITRRRNNVFFLDPTKKNSKV